MFVSWGERAGAISVSLQMLTNDGNPDGLFRAAFMQSGSHIRTGDITQVREPPITFTELLRNLFFRANHIMTTSSIALDAPVTLIPFLVCARYPM
jgi:hypothetical protein